MHSLRGEGASGNHRAQRAGLILRALLLDGSIRSEAYGIPCMAELKSSEGVKMEPVAFIGGIRYGGSNASRPLAELVVHDQGVTIGLRWRFLSKLLGRWLPTLTVHWDDIDTVYSIRGAILLRDNVGIRFIRRGSDQRRFVFWCTRADRTALIEILTNVGVNVIDGGVVW
jgi:hypothetical protein